MCRCKELPKRNFSLTHTKVRLTINDTILFIGNSSNLTYGNRTYLQEFYILLEDVNDERVEIVL